MHPLRLLEHQFSTQSLEGFLFPNCASQGRLLIIREDSQEIYPDGKGVLVEGRSSRAVSLKGDRGSRDPTQSLHTWTEHRGIPSCEITCCQHMSFLISRFGAVFSMKFSFGVKTELFYLPLWIPKSIGRGAGQAHAELPPPQIKAWYLSILWVLLVLGERMMLNSWHDAQLLPSQLLTLTEQVRAGDEYRQTTKPA